MMKTNRLLTTIIAVVIIFSSCIPWKQETIPSFIYGYYDIDSVNVTIKTENIIQLHQSNGTKIVCDWKSKRSRKTLYDSLCNAHDDKGYNKEICYFISPEEEKDKTTYKYLYDYYTIDVTSDADFDLEHPKGTLLNDIIMFYGATVKSFIESGYRHEYNWENIDVPDILLWSYGFSGSPYTLVAKKLSEMTPEDYHLGTSFSCLVFKKEPTLSKKHKLTISIKNTNNIIVPISFYANGTRNNPRKLYVPIEFE